MRSIEEKRDEEQGRGEGGGRDGRTAAHVFGTGLIVMGCLVRGVLTVLLPQVVLEWLRRTLKRCIVHSLKLHPEDLDLAGRLPDVRTFVLSTASSFPATASSFLWTVHQLAFWSVFFSFRAFFPLFTYPDSFA